MDRLDHRCLISIFKHLDLPSRLQASKTCKLWRALLQDSEVLLDYIGEVYFNEWKPDQDKSEVPSVLAVLSHVMSCRQLKLGPGTAPLFLSEELLKDELTRFDNVVIIPEEDGWGDSLVPCLSLLPSTVTRLRIEDVSLSQGLTLNLPDSVQLEALELSFCHVESGSHPFVLPSTLSMYGYTYYRPNWNVPPFNSDLATDHFLNSFPVGPLLMDLKVRGLYFDDKRMSYFLRMIRDGLPNLHRLSFQDVAFAFKYIDLIRREFSVGTSEHGRLLPFQRIEFKNCVMHWNVAVDLFLRISDVKMIVISLRQQSSPEQLAAVYELTPAIKQKGAKLELTITMFLGDPAKILVPSELTCVLSKLELLGVYHPALFCGNNSFELLTEIRLECLGAKTGGKFDLGDADLEIVAKWCKNLKKLKFQPDFWQRNWLGLKVVTDQCLLPFIDHWDDRKSTQLFIECLEPARPFDAFDLPSGQEKGVFDDGKKWMLFRKACRLDGCDRLGTRLVIWDDHTDGGGKSMVITNYKRKFENNIQISVMNGGCIVKQKMGVEFHVDD